MQQCLNGEVTWVGYTTVKTASYNHNYQTLKSGIGWAATKELWRAQIKVVNYPIYFACSFPTWPSALLETLHHLPYLSKNCLPLGFCSHVFECMVPWPGQGRRRQPLHLLLSAGLNVYTVYILVAELFPTCGALLLCKDCTMNTSLAENVPTNSGSLLLHCIHANCTTKPQLFFLGLLSQNRFPPLSPL
jgi:hypothetical protein